MRISADKRRDLKNTFSNELERICEAWELHLTAAMTLNRYDTFRRQSGLSVNDLVSEALISWMDSVCEHATELSNTGAHIGISRNSLPDDTKDGEVRESIRELTWNHKIEKVGSDAYVTQLLEELNLDAFITHASDAMADIEVLGYKEAAVELAKALGFFGYGVGCSSNSDKVFYVKQQRGGFLLEYANHGYQHERERKFRDLVLMAETFEHEAGVSGLSVSLKACADVENGLGFDDTVASRTQVGNDTSVRATFYKKKVKIWLSEPVFSALVGFITTYADDERLGSVQAA